uniref:Atp synthase mitochondrial f1 complex assembly factor 1 n=1 Tax=Triatoma infestans TaxID=30076 RepID=A0A171AZ02_TRIIF
MEMIENKTAEEIKNIWMDYHKGKDVLFSTYSYDQFQKLNSNYTKYPTFVFPLPRGDGYEFFLFQYVDSELHFTPMVQFKKHGANAPECLAVIYFPDLKDKDIILMRGEYDKDVVSPLDSQYLINLTQMFYNGESTKCIDLIEQFNNKPDEFKYPEIISEVERMGFLRVK